MSWRRGCAGGVLGVLVLLPAGSPASPGSEAVARGDAAYARRAEGQEDGRPVAGPIDEAIAAYEEALEREPSSLEAAWKLLRALYFKGDFTTRDRDERREIFGRGRDVAEVALDVLGQCVGGRDVLDDMDPDDLRAKLDGTPEVGPLYFWSAANWGSWATHYGALAAVREGVAGRVRDYTRMVMELAPEVEGGGGHRIHARLHAVAPRVPFITGWVDRDIAVPTLERAIEIAPDYPANRLMLGVTLLEQDRRDEALELLRALVELEPRAAMLVEDLAVRRSALRILERASSSASD